jgi:Putative endonuclease, protein of unknown function (DUF1780)
MTTGLMSMICDTAYDSARLFSNAQKVEREKMVCRAFLRCAGIQFSEDELLKGLNEPVDMSFRDGLFQITELLDTGRRRGTELRVRQQKCQSATSADDLLEPWEGSTPIALAEIGALVADRLATKSHALGGPRGCKGIDALVYVNLRGRHLFAEALVRNDANLAAIRAQGWRSASLVMIPYAIVLLADHNSPAFLCDINGKVLMDERRTDGWFEA